ncbi:emp24/gp25L/p24 family/GOLD-domain-containing protein [Leucosporidium creatinivorum]|uniref:Emp24/gp25L/p24 family/GOLD-domain-containing protein n=1 Tax=Leucosporidium creatinivorum TaxID=106004 RepID=A0A1Y2G3E1_9BASI|nr:emp24/gp25L/p24 family/GOLD-domain-containing protein [Leucosporidium creatinivorum]
MLRLPLVVAFLSLLHLSSALYFYLDAGENRCFLEELPKDTIVVGHYKAEEWQESTKNYIVNDQLGIQIVVQEVDSGDKVVNTRGLPQGKFTFTSHEAGDHTICLRSNYTGGWFSTPQVRMHLDIAVGEAKVDEEGEREHVKDLAGKVKDLNSRLADIRREQVFQREREAEFRSLSETTNSRAVWWSIAQLITLIATCTWQLRHLRMFFESKKLR